MGRVYGLLIGAIGCLLAVAGLVLFAWLEVTLTPPDQCASETCGDVWLFPLFVGPWFVIGAIVFSLAALVSLRRRRRMLRDGVAEELAGRRPATTATLASPGLRIVGGLIDVVVIVVAWAIIGTFLNAIKGGIAGATVNNIAGLVDLVAVLAYFCYFWSARGQSIGMMVFGFRVRDMRSGRYPTPGRALLRGFVWSLEVLFTFLLVGAIGWLWQLWDPEQQAVHDKLAGTVVTAR
jgi:uncharacterized RDD family membrane protein YckC